MQTDAEFLGLIPNGPAGIYRVPVVDRLARFDGRLYGGAAIAISVAAAELATDRPALWVTTQFVGTVEVGTVIDIRAEILAAGHRTNQVRVTATAPDGAVVFASLGATGRHKDGPLNGTFERRPIVSRPEDSIVWSSPISGMARAVGIDEPPVRLPRKGFGLAMEVRQATIVDHPDPGPGRVCLWVRRRDSVAITPALAAYLADMVPLSVVHALGVLAGGTSLDNTIRIGSFVGSEWILLDLRPHLAAGGYAHGVAHIWSETGELVATASQTASMFEVDLEALRSAFVPGEAPIRPDGG